MTKQAVSRLAFDYGCSAHYCGSTKTMFFTAMKYMSGLPTIEMRAELVQYGTFKGFKPRKRKYFLFKISGKLTRRNQTV